MDYKKIINKLFANNKIGQLSVILPDATVMDFHGEKKGPKCEFKINDYKTLSMILKRGDIGLGEAYFMGLWDSKNVADFLTYCSLNLDHIKNNGNASILNRLMFYIYNQFVKMNTRHGSRKNIMAHYDISNDFYKIWLDSSMTYSSGIRNDKKNDTLNDAQINKYKKIIDEIKLQDKNVLEIGCGWGGFAKEAVKKGANLTGITISSKQYDFARKLLRNTASIKMQDYRDVSLKYDRIVSIEMFEAVGIKYWPAYFDKVKTSLVKGGKALIQTITICDNEFKQYKKNSDYIRHHVFPGGILPSKNNFIKHAKKANLDVVDVFEFGDDYAWTLNQWLKNFKKNVRKIQELGVNRPY